jgi:steroid delta-isomerase-like uncharacterized protein
VTPEEVDMSNRTIAEQYFQAIARGDIGAAVACFGGGAEFVGPMGPVPVPEGLRAFLQGYEDSFPGARFEVTNSVEAGDQIAIEGFWSGRHTGVLALPDGRKVPATHRDVRAPFVTIFRVRDGKIASHRGYWDLAGFMAQLS